MQPVVDLVVSSLEQISEKPEGQVHVHLMGTSVVLVETAYGSTELLASRTRVVVNLSLGLNTEG